MNDYIKTKLPFDIIFGGGVGLLMYSTTSYFNLPIYFVSYIIFRIIGEKLILKSF